MKARCIFCKRDSSDSRGKEHILPESLGNTLHLLQAGVVCDDCNTYFAVKLEGPVLSSGYFETLRFRQRVPNKKGRITPQKAIMGCGVPVTLRHGRNDEGLFIDVPTEHWDHVTSMNDGEIIFPMTGAKPDPDLMSRFLCKVAYEAFADRILSADESMRDQMIDDEQLDLIRHWARYASGSKDWIFSERRIYDEDHMHPRFEKPSQIFHEWDFLITRREEMYFVVAVFGVEYALNMAGSCIDGYQEWLAENDEKSPLYSGKYAEQDVPPNA